MMERAFPDVTDTHTNVELELLDVAHKGRRRQE